MKHGKKISIGVIAVLSVAVVAVGVKILNNQVGVYDEFTRCLSEKGTKFYGAFWCPHCQNQKALFGKSAKLLPYIECSTPNGQGVLPICQEKKITGYPTWIFPDGSRQSGETPLQTLGDKSGCKLPESAPRPTEAESVQKPAMPTPKT